ncbi:hypothetical protein D6851_09715 [Altericroceibacterium spongiae]|uniref:PepSY domain-containing protein n=1 Tax=Altericroceibacterium spongiae TaxID=2320269 RepID=A0A420EKC2_9SPHN|nr:PepSY domain-containing protein [Altericroceibacterium spongiae]RKF21181.1 hypothetical protein D6851_09715 [Altericroceibacterium spongiae]
MRKLTVALAILPAFLCLGAPSFAAEQSRDEQGQVRKAIREGNVQSLRDIERKVLPQMKGHEYLGPEYDAAAKAYRLKFIKDGRVVFIDVDARSGRIISRSN